MNEQQQRQLWVQVLVSSLAGAAVTGQNTSTELANAVRLADAAIGAAQTRFPEVPKGGAK